MFVDQITIYAKAGDGGDGVVRWNREKFKPKGGPAGGNGGRGGSIVMRAVRDVNLLAKYTGEKKFEAEKGGDGMNKNLHGKNGENLVVDIPVGSIVTDEARGRVYEFMSEGQTEIIFKGGRGGLGNRHFRSAINQAPEESTLGKKGEEGTVTVTLSLVVDVGLIGKPNAGKSTLLNTLTNANSKIGSYPFTTIEPHLGDLNGYVLADIPGLIAGASSGKGLGHTFLRHVTHTKMLLHLISVEEDDVLSSYQAIRDELFAYDTSLVNKEEWVIITKIDLINKAKLDELMGAIDKIAKRVLAISVNSGVGIKELQTALSKHLLES
ncbi:MAG: GTPase ObgE [Candidatus Nomurabacteria bacterium]|nr:GTPase ObgE [Candidatus Nomurabacteria bacterium]USN88117.1 MAG: GTPase ObgE [Candidatus Nomurabacteria bacterium]